MSASATDLHDLYKALQTRGRAVAIPAKVLGRLKLGEPAADISGKEIVIVAKDQEKRGITAFELEGQPTLAIFHVEPERDDAWLIRFSLDGQILKQEWNQGGYRTYELHSDAVAQREIDFWRDWMAEKKRPAPMTADRAGK